jgi:hypothetical protein
VITRTVPSGPLAVRWTGVEVPSLKAGALAVARVELANAGSATWVPDGPRRVCLGYHFLDELGNPIVWDGLWTRLPNTIDPGQRVATHVDVRVPVGPGRYRLAFDLVADNRLWFSEVGNAAPEVTVDVAPRLSRRALAVRGADQGSLDALEEPVVEEASAEAIAYLAPACVPAPDWSRRILDAHEEGYAVVGGSIEVAAGLFRRGDSELAPWAPGTGRIPGFGHPLLCPSVLVDVDSTWNEPIAGLPAMQPPSEEPWLYDGRIAIRFRPRSGRRRA